MKRWSNDLGIGVRIALGGGRNSWRRLVLIGVGVGLGVAVLLVGASASTVVTARQIRQDLSMVTAGEDPIPGVDPLYRVYRPEAYHGDHVMGSYVLAGGPGAPVPPGLERIPGDGEIVLSPALAELLASPEGEALRPRFPQRVVGTIGQDGLVGPNHLLYIAGDSSVPRFADTAYYRFGRYNGVQLDSLTSGRLLLVVLGLVVLLLPVLLFTVISTRLAGPERERRMAALRLLGAGPWQVRRVAAGDALVGAVIGLVLGTGIFLLAREFAERVELFEVRIFRSDLVPPVGSALLIAVLVPVLSVLTALVTMRSSTVDPLGVARQAEPPPRRLWWRLVPVVVGVVVLATKARLFTTTFGNQGVSSLLIGIALLLLGIPLLLPWTVERVVGRIRGGGPPSWQLAVRGLQMDSGSAARVVGGVAVVLAGGIAVQTVLLGIGTERPPSLMPAEMPDQVSIGLEGEAVVRADEFADRIRGLDGVVSVLSRRNFYIVRTEPPADAAPGRPARAEAAPVGVLVGTCDTLRGTARIDACRDGDAFFLDNPSDDRWIPDPGERVAMHRSTSSRPREGVEWTVPDLTAVVRPLVDTQEYDLLLVTPAAARDVDVDYQDGTLLVIVDPAVPGAAERARNVLGPLGWQATSWVYERNQPQSHDDYATFRRIMLVGALVTVLLAGASLLALALEQVRSRRRPLAVLAAGGVPHGTVLRSLLWRNTVPLLIAVVVAVVTGSGLGLLLLRARSSPLMLDFAGIGVLSAVAVVTVLLVTLCTLPAVRRATGVMGLRVE
ncbi:ABC transporter permease [Umezawaea sp. Da 62-37]|uniref:ABC transporter permease n=1 Tax=Umezawaea sp. Da 62-37 TaxID=3075927 RepID=UPI0028F74514|nr:ABC transporter permease [Umezawaea sp. Da 62-37]WNV91096.1 ABC transporter permease [Umezawaea sp. Da 62-37]